jgi:hypothetical protein
MKARIYKPSKSSMQSGRGKLDQWVLDYELATQRTPEGLMGWTSSADTNNQVSLKFDTLESAIEFAQAQGLKYTVLHERQRRVKPRNYGDNFRYIPPQEGKSAR